jgi:hypothetical protein
MAREARKQLADLRAMEEEHERMTMHGRGKTFHGAGATPSMGLSQFRGGAKKKYESEDEDDMEGGNILALTNAFRGAIRAPIRITPSSRALVPLGPAGRPMATPSLSRSYYQNLFSRQNPTTRFRPTTTTTTAPRANVAQTARRGLTAQAIAQAIAMGIPLGMVGAYLASGGDGSVEDGGYYDDLAGPEFGPDGPTIPGAGPSFGPSDGGPSMGVPSDMDADELAWYLQSGNLPERYSSRAPRARRGKGKLTITHGDEMEGGFRLPVKLDDWGLDPNQPGIRLPINRKPSPPSKKPYMPSPYRPEEGPGGPGGRPDRRLPEPIYRKPVKPNMPEDLGGPGRQPVRDGRMDRADIVKQIMKERGVSLPQASSIVKNEGLY